MRASLYLAPAAPADLTGFVQVGEPLPDGSVYLHAEPGRAPLPGWTVLRDGREAPWSWAGLKVDLPDVAERVLEATWEGDEPGTVGRGPIARGKAIGKIPTPIETDLPPHMWLGDEP